MAVQVSGEYIPSKSVYKVWDLYVPSAQFPLSSTVLGVNMNVTASLGTATNNYNQSPTVVPGATTIVEVILTSYGAAPTAGTITLTVGGTALTAVTGTTISLTSFGQIATNISLGAGTRYVVSGTTTGWAQASGGLHIEVWGYTTY